MGDVTERMYVHDLGGIISILAAIMHSNTTLKTNFNDFLHIAV
jgi:hypothetical protein